MLNASYPPTPSPGRDDWMKFPPGFIPPPPCHPTLRVVTEQQILNRVGRLLNSGQKEEALKLAHAMARALSYPHTPPPPMLLPMTAGPCQCPECRAKRGEEAA